MYKIIMLSLCCSIGFLGFSCNDSDESTDNATKENVPDPGAKNLEGMMTKLQKAIHSGDTSTAAEMSRGLLVNADELEDLLSADCPVEIKENIVKMHARFSSAPDSAIAKLLMAKPEQTNITAHPSTGAEIKEYKKGSLAFKEFPGGARSLAVRGVFNEDMTYYEVELIAPDKEYGMTYHLFVWDGSGWKILGPIWRKAR